MELFYVHILWTHIQQEEVLILQTVYALRFINIFFCIVALYKMIVICDGNACCSPLKFSMHWLLYCDFVKCSSYIKNFAQISHAFQIMEYTRKVWESNCLVNKQWFSYQLKPSNSLETFHNSVNPFLSSMYILCQLSWLFSKAKSQALIVKSAYFKVELQLFDNWICHFGYWFVALAIDSSLWLLNSLLN